MNKETIQMITRGYASDQNYQTQQFLADEQAAAARYSSASNFAAYKVAETYGLSLPSKDKRSAFLEGLERLREGNTEIEILTQDELNSDAYKLALDHAERPIFTEDLDAVEKQLVTKEDADILAKTEFSMALERIAEIAENASMESNLGFAATQLAAASACYEKAKYIIDPELREEYIAMANLALKDATKTKDLWLSGKLLRDLDY